MEILKLLHKISDQIEIKDTQELLLDLEPTDEAKYEVRTQELKIEITEEISELQDLLDDKANAENIVSMFDTLTETLGSIYRNTNLDLSKLAANVKGTEIEEKLKEIIESK